MIPYQMILVFNVVREGEEWQNFIVVVGVYFLIGRSDLVWILLNYVMHYYYYSNIMNVNDGYGGFLLLCITRNPLCLLLQLLLLLPKSIATL